MTTKQRGYRIRATIFLPCDPKNRTATRAALDFADALERLPNAPEGAIVEDFSCAPGRREDDRVQTDLQQPEAHTIERVGPPTPKGDPEIPEGLRRTA